MLTDDRLRELWANGFTITVMAGPFVEHFARSVEREARREALETAARRAEAFDSQCAAAIRALKEKP